MKKLLAKLRSLIIGIGTSASVIACGSESETKSKTDLNTIIFNKNLGKIIITNSFPTKEELLVGIKNINSNAVDLSLEDFDFKKGVKKGLKKSIIIGKGKYKGEIILEYSNINLNMQDFLNHLILLNYQKIYGENEVIFATISNIKTNLEIEEITSNERINTVVLSETLINSDKSEFKNSSNIQQQNITQTFTKTVTNTISITKRIDIGIKQKIKISFPEFFDSETEFDFTWSRSKTTTNTQTKIITSSAQRINVPPHKQIDVFIELYKTKAHSEYLLTLKLNKNSTFSGEVTFGNKTSQTGPFNQKFNFYNILNDLGIINNYDLLYTKNGNLYYKTWLLINTTTNDFKVTEKERSYL